MGNGRGGQVGAAGWECYFLEEMVWGAGLSSVESDAYLTAPRPGGNNGIACQRYGAGAHAVSALFACQLLQFRVRALALV